jgi:hypothetical protein
MGNTQAYNFTDWNVDELKYVAMKQWFNVFLILDRRDSSRICSTFLTPSRDWMKFLQSASSQHRPFSSFSIQPWFSRILSYPHSAFSSSFWRQWNLPHQAFSQFSAGRIRTSLHLITATQIITMEFFGIQSKFLGHIAAFQTAPKFLGCLNSVPFHIWLADGSQPMYYRNGK